MTAIDAHTAGRATLRVGFVGLGHMGGPMALCLAAAGVPITVLDLRDDIVAAVAGASPAVAASSLAQLAGDSDVVITMLPSGPVVAEVVLGSGGLADMLAPGAVVVDMSSCAPHETLALGEQLALRSVDLVDAPVSGGVARARAGDLAIIVGGSDDAVARCRPVLEHMARDVFHVGPLGSGHALKALNNALSAAGLAAAAEVLLVGRRFGLDPGVMIDVFNSSSGRNNATENKLRQFVLSGSYSSGFGLDLLAKDLAIAVDIAARAEVDHPFSDAALQLVGAAGQALGSQADHTEVVRYMQQRCGVELDGEPA